MSLSVGANLVKLGEGGFSFTGNFKRYWNEGFGNRAFLSTGAVLGEPVRDSLIWYSKGYVKRALETGISPYGSPLL